MDHNIIVITSNNNFENKQHSTLFKLKGIYQRFKLPIGYGQAYSEPEYIREFPFGKEVIT